jgi:hypothetical protein
VLDDATVALPLIVGAVLERLGYRYEDGAKPAKATRAQRK